MALDGLTHYTLHLFSNLSALDWMNNLANNFCIYLDLDLKILFKKQLIHR